MCNHSFNPSAVVRVRHGDGHCQGLDALDEVCAPPSPSAAADPFANSLFELVAGPEGIPAGEEVTISYGSWLNEAFLLLFGFVPDGNEHDAVVLFPSVVNLAEEWLIHGSMEAQGNGDGGFEDLLEAVLSQPLLFERARSGAFERLIVGDRGVDARMQEAVEMVAAATASAAGRHASQTHESAQERCNRFVLDACRRRLATLQAASSACTTITSGAYASRFRVNKERILSRVILQMEPRVCQTSSG